MLALQKMVTSAPANNKHTLLTAMTALQRVAEMVPAYRPQITSSETTPTTSPTADTQQTPAAASSPETTAEKPTATFTATATTTAADAARGSIQSAVNPPRVVAVQALPRLPEHIDLTSDTEEEDQFFDAHESSPPLPSHAKQKATSLAASAAASTSAAAAAAAAAVAETTPTRSNWIEDKKRKAVVEPVVASGSGRLVSAAALFQPDRSCSRPKARGPVVTHRNGTQHIMRPRAFKSLNNDFNDAPRPPPHILAAAKPAPPTTAAPRTAAAAVPRTAAAAAPRTAAAAVPRTAAAAAPRTAAAAAHPTDLPRTNLARRDHAGDSTFPRRPKVRATPTRRRECETLSWVLQPGAPPASLHRQPHLFPPSCNWNPRFCEDPTCGIFRFEKNNLCSL
jgi:hypothetical protein